MHITVSFQSVPVLTKVNVMSVKKRQKIVFPNYGQLSSRLGSYKTLEEDSLLYRRKKDFAEAGFFSTGTDDRVICYYCGGGLMDFDEDDSPWIEHAHWFSKCVFVNLLKGQDFVNKCKERSFKQSTVSEFNSPTPTAATDSKFECIVCIDNVRNAVFYPCKHLCVCCHCALNFDNCVYCRKPIDSLEKIFIP